MQYVWVSILSYRASQIAVSVISKKTPVMEAITKNEDERTAEVKLVSWQILFTLLSLVPPKKEKCSCLICWEILKMSGT